MTLFKEDHMIKEIKNYPNYRISDDGKIYSCYEGLGHKAKPSNNWKELQQVYDKSSGYMLVTLSNKNGRKNKRVHRLLMETFIPNPNPSYYKHVNHKDGNKLNNSLDNLEWASPKENAAHAVKYGLCEPCFKATRKAIVQYSKDNQFISEYESIHEAERVTGVAWQNISKVINGKRSFAGGFRWYCK